MLAIFWRFSRMAPLDQHVPAFIALALLEGALYLAGVWIVERTPPGWAALLLIIGGAVLFRAVLLPVAPSLSQDVYRYAWEGRVERRHHNPYAAYPALDGLSRLELPGHPIEGGLNMTAVYPPLNELVFSHLHSVQGYKRFFTALDLATVAVLLALLSLLKQPLTRVIIYAWNPAVIISFALGSHNDSLAILTLTLAYLLIIIRKPLASNGLLALSAVSKAFAVLFLPLFLKRSKWAYAGIFAAIAVLVYLPFVGAGRKLFHGLSDYARGWESNDSLFRAIHAASASKAQAEFVAGVLIAVLVICVIRSGMPILRAGLFITAGLLLLSPDAFPWYFTWSVPFLCFYPSAPWLLMTVTCVLGYAPVAAYAAGQPYRDSPLILALEYAPVIVWLAYEGWSAYVSPQRHSSDIRF